MNVIVYIGLGANLGDREATIRRALEILDGDPRIEVTRCSTVIETDPVGDVGGAVKRNRARRLLREAARSVVDKWNQRDLWVVLVAKSTITESTSRSVQDDIERRLARAGLLAENIE